jgi:hypothetical protein
MGVQTLFLGKAIMEFTLSMSLRSILSFESSLKLCISHGMQSFVWQCCQTCRSEDWQHVLIDWKHVAAFMYQCPTIFHNLVLDGV